MLLDQNGMLVNIIGHSYPLSLHSLCNLGKRQEKFKPLEHEILLSVMPVDRNLGLEKFHNNLSTEDESEFLNSGVH